MAVSESGGLWLGDSKWRQDVEKCGSWGLRQERGAVILLLLRGCGFARNSEGTETRIVRQDCLGFLFCGDSSLDFELYDVADYIPWVCSDR
jgi:hypothetical protein